LASGSNACGSAAGTAITGTGTGSAQTQTIYGQVYGSFGPTPTVAGNYTDTATVTVTF
jgi:spore coat protein U-like protein